MKEARKKCLADVACRCVRELSKDTKRIFVIATLLAPGYKHYAFRSEAERRLAETALRNEWQHWKGAQKESTSVLNRAKHPKRPQDFFDDSDDDVGQALAITDELDLYLSLAQQRKDMCVPAWWRNFRLAAPPLAERKRQFLGSLPVQQV